MPRIKAINRRFFTLSRLPTPAQQEPKTLKRAEQEKPSKMKRIVIQNTIGLILLSVCITGCMHGVTVKAGTMDHPKNTLIVKTLGNAHGLHRIIFYCELSTPKKIWELIRSPGNAPQYTTIQYGCVPDKMKQRFPIGLTPPETISPGNQVWIYVEYTADTPIPSICHENFFFNIRPDGSLEKVASKKRDINLADSFYDPLPRKSK